MQVAVELGAPEVSGWAEQLAIPVPLSENATEPDGAPAPGAAGVTLAV